MHAKHSARATQPPLAGPAYALREDAMRAADDFAARRDLDPAWVRQALAQAHYLPQVAKFIQPPPVGTQVSTPATSSTT